MEVKEKANCCEDMFAGQVESVVINCGNHSCKLKENHNIEHTSRERTARRVNYMMKPSIKCRSSAFELWKDRD
jgi:hypothetical protein